MDAGDDTAGRLALSQAERLFGDARHALVDVEQLLADAQRAAAELSSPRLAARQAAIIDAAHAEAAEVIAAAQADAARILARAERATGADTDATQPPDATQVIDLRLAEAHGPTDATSGDSTRARLVAVEAELQVAVSAASEMARQVSAEVARLAQARPERHLG